MDETGKKILFVVEDNNKIVGVVTDGNIRRWFLKGYKLTESMIKL